jgi:hypothetical protein
MLQDKLSQDSQQHTKITGYIPRAMNWQESNLNRRFRYLAGSNFGLTVLKTGRTRECQAHRRQLALATLGR